jgi:hypothetical protein
VKAQGSNETNLYHWLDKDARKLGAARLYYRLRLL